MDYRIEKNIHIKPTEGMGKCMFAKRAFKKGEIVFVAYGPLVTKATPYTIPIDHELKIEPREPEGNLCQFICHSCEPNIGVKHRTVFVEMNDIKKDELVATHYGFLGYEYGDELAPEDRACRCKTPSCTGKLGCYKDLTSEERKKWREYISDYLLDERYN